MTTSPLVYHRLSFPSILPGEVHVELCSGKIFDRTEDADIDSGFTERKISPYVTIMAMFKNAGLL
jgi:hypothetical protein